MFNNKFTNWTTFGIPFQSYELISIPFQSVNYLADVIGEEPEAYQVNVELTNVSADEFNPVLVLKGTNAKLTFTSSGTLPEDITLEGCTYEWDNTIGELTLFDVRRNVYIKIDRESL